MEISIIIVNWNTRDLLKQCLRSLESSRPDVLAEIIVVDNDSADGSSEMVTSCFPAVKLIDSGGNLGFGRGSNLGSEQATAPLVLFLNPDTEVRGDSLRKMIDFMQQNTGVGALGCKIRDVDGGVKQLGIQWFPSPFTELLKFLAISKGTYKSLARLLPCHDPEVSGYVEKLYGACLLVRRQVLEQVGSFDERFFMYCEDVDLCRRITRAGWKLFYLSDVEILHWGGSASSKAPGGFAVLMGCESFSKLMRKHHGRMGSVGFRLVTFIGAHARILMLFALYPPTCVRARRKLHKLSGSIRKYCLMIKWALGLQKPTIK